MKNRKRIHFGWAFYDWANSVYSLVISTAIFPIYFAEVTPDVIELGQSSLPSSTLYSYSLTTAFILVVFLSPFLSGIADYVGQKKRFLQFFCYLGALSCSGLYFFTGTNLWYGLILSITAGVGFWGSLVFYNAFLPEIARPDEQDRLSARGFSLGYLGASLLLIINLVSISMPEALGLEDAGSASRLSFLLVGLWWAGFAQVTFRRLPVNIHRRKPGKHYIWSGFRELRQVARQLKHLPYPRRFLYSFFFFSVGVQTVILLASLFGEEELQLDSDKLILTILIIQFVGIGGAQLFSWIARRFGNRLSLQISIAIWALICLGAYSLRHSDPWVEYKFYLLGGFVGLVLGGIQAISRSTYSKLIPESRSTASFFSFYDVSEKVAIILGTFMYGYLIDLTGNMRSSALALGIFFVLGYLLLLRVDKKAFRSTK